MRNRKDANQALIVENLKLAGCVVEDLSQAGGGLPDLLVGYNGHLFLFEIKDAAQPKHRHELTTAQKAFFKKWRGYPVYKVFGTPEIFRIIGGGADFQLAIELDAPEAQRQQGG